MNTSSTAARSTIRPAHAIAVALALSLVVAACGGDDDDSAGDTGTAETTADTATADTGTADTGTADTGTADTGTADTGTADTATDDTTTSTQAPPSGWNGVNAGPSDVEAILTSIGKVESGGDCAGLPYVRSELLVYLSPAIRAEESQRVGVSDALREVLPDLGIDTSSDDLFPPPDSDQPGRAVFVLPTANEVSLGAVQDANVNELLLQFEGGVAVGVNHIGPYLPIGTFHPGTDPVEADPANADDAADMATAGTTDDVSHSVLVVDSPPADDDSFASYDVWKDDWTGGPDNKIDFVAGHGPFVRDIIATAAPDADISFSSVVADASWPSFLFAESDLIDALEAGLGATGSPRLFSQRFDLINFSLGTFGCDGETHSPLAKELTEILSPDSYTEPDPDRTTVFVAAAGNEGTERPHFPAAFADPANGSPDLADHTISVGAATSDGSDTHRLCSSNFGSWVRAWAPGVAVAEFPPAWANQTGYARWSGTSFATARVTGTLADAPDDVLSTWTTAAGGQIGPDPLVRASSSGVDIAACSG